MKKTIFICLLLACVSCVTNPDNGFNKEGVPKEITRTFEEFGFLITAPCDLFCNKYPSHAFVVAEYYSIQKNLPFYRIEVREKLIIDELSETEQNEEMDEMIRTCFISIMPARAFSASSLIYVVGRNFAARLIAFGR